MVQAVQICQGEDQPARNNIFMGLDRELEEGKVVMERDCYRVMVGIPLYD